MKLIAFALAAFSATTAAQSSGSVYDMRSSGFRLIIKSDNSTLNGTALGACHQGAAIEGLCPSGQKLEEPASTYTTFYHHISSSGENKSANANNTLGGISWTLRAGSLEVPSAMTLSYNYFSNLANPTFYPSNDSYAPVGFKDCGSMYMEMSTDDTVSPPVYLSPPRKVSNWYICLTRWSYLYSTLSWKIGVTGEPQNPSCQKVEVTRVFV